MASRPLLVLALSGLAASLGCGGAQAGPTVVTTTRGLPPLSVASAPARFSVRVKNHLAWPYRLRRVLVVVDGEKIADERVAGDREAPGEVVVPVGCAPGEHTLQMLVDTDMPVTATGPDCAFELRAVRTFAVAEGQPAEIGADLYLRDLPHDFPDRLDLAYQIRGTVPMDHGYARPLPSADEARCKALPAADGAGCRVEARLADAIQRRDVIEATCTKEKLDQLRVFARMRVEALAQAEAARARDVERGPRLPPPPIAVEGAPSPDPSAPPPAATDLEEQDYRFRAKLLEQRMTALGKEADLCAGGDGTEWVDQSVVQACPLEKLPEVDFDAPFRRQSRPDG